MAFGLISGGCACLPPLNSCRALDSQGCVCVCVCVFVCVCVCVCVRARAFVSVCEQAMESLHYAAQQQTSTYLNAFEKISVLMPSPAMVFAEIDQTDFLNLILMPDIVKQRGRSRKLRIKSSTNVLGSWKEGTGNPYTARPFVLEN